MGCGSPSEPKKLKETAKTKPPPSAKPPVTNAPVITVAQAKIEEKKESAPAKQEVEKEEKAVPTVQALTAPHPPREVEQEKKRQQEPKSKPDAVEEHGAKLGPHSEPETHDAPAEQQPPAAKEEKAPAKKEKAIAETKKLEQKAEEQDPAQKLAKMGYRFLQIPDEEEDGNVPPSPHNKAEQQAQESKLPTTDRMIAGRIDEVKKDPEGMFAPAS